MTSHGSTHFQSRTLLGKLASFLITAIAIALAFGAASPGLASNVDVHAWSSHVTADGHDHDTDGDGLPDQHESRRFGTNPLHADSDRDGLTDGDEVSLYATQPLNVDTDGDGLLDAEEIRLESDPLTADTDGDGLDDGDEIALGADPSTTDSDGDGLDDGLEVRILGSSPVSTDSDADGLADGDEVDIYGTNPAWNDAERVYIFTPVEAGILPEKSSSAQIRSIDTARVTNRPMASRIPVAQVHSMPALMALD